MSVDKYKSDFADLEILDSSGQEDVAEIFVARFRGSDGPVLEFVDGLDTRFARSEKWIVNISTQFGCPVNCIFCDAGGEFKGNVTKDEMLAQARYILARHSDLSSVCKKLKVHFARMGEPALNDDVLLTMRALPLMPELKDNKNLWCCVPTTSPKGRDKWFAELKALKNDLYHGRFQLQFSVNSTSEKERERLMPFPHWSMDQISKYGTEFYLPGDRRPVLNFALANNVPFDVSQIIKRFDPKVFAVKLTPLNPTARGIANGLDTILRSEKNSKLNDATDELTSQGFDVVISIGDGREDEIGSNCGQAVRKLGLFGNESETSKTA